MKNGYFQLVSDERGFGLLIKAPVDGGERVRIAEVTDYLNKRNMGCDLSTLKSAIMLNKDTVLHLGTMPCPEVNMTYNSCSHLQIYKIISKVSLSCPIYFRGHAKRVR